MITETATAKLAAAIGNEALYKDVAKAKLCTVSAAKAKRAELVGLAATGADVDAAALMQAEEDTRIASAELEIANAIFRGAERYRQEAEVSYWFDEAQKLKNAVERSLDERISAATDVDHLFTDVSRAVTRFNEAGQSFSNARIAASQFTADRDARIASNPVLASMPAGTHPNAKDNYNAEIRKVDVAIFDAGGGLERPAPIQNLTQREVFLWGRAASNSGLQR